MPSQINGSPGTSASSGAPCAARKAWISRTRVAFRQTSTGARAIAPASTRGLTTTRESRAAAFSTMRSKASNPRSGSASASARSRIGLSAACRCTRESPSFASAGSASNTIPCPPPTGASCAGSPNSTSVANSSRRSACCRSSSIEASSISPMSSGSSRRFQPLMKSEPLSPALASAPGIDGCCRKKAIARSRPASSSASTFGRSALPVSHSAIAS